MHARRFLQVDVFSHRTGNGNPLAVLPDAQDLSDADMQRFATWANLSETAYLLPPTEAGQAAGADYRVRIFSPQGELPFAGHPTLGSCHAWQHLGHTPRTAGAWVQECAIGLVRIRQHGDILAFAAPPLQRSAPNPAMLALVTAALGLRPQQVRAAQVLDNGPRFLALLLDSKEAVLGIHPDHARLKDLGQDVGLVHIAPTASDAQTPGATVRAFLHSIGNPEDPVTGSLNAGLAQWLIAEGLAPAHYQVAQGECVGRAGRVSVCQDEAGQVWVGGHTVTSIEGQVFL